MFNPKVEIAMVQFLLLYKLPWFFPARPPVSIRPSFNPKPPRAPKRKYCVLQLYAI